MNERTGVIIMIMAVVGGLALGCDAGLSVTPTPGTSSPTAPTPPLVYPAPQPNPSPPLPLPSATPGAVIPVGAEPAVALARTDLARRLGLKTEAIIAVESVEAVDWPDTSLGCPQPGMMYAQVITPGYRVTLRVTAQGERYEYHTDMGRQAVLCEKRALVGKTPVPTVDLANPQAQRAAEAARADLAQRLGVDPAGITVVTVRADDFPAQNLGCWPPGAEPGPVQPAFVTGLEIVLATGGQEYVYRAHGSQVVFCGPW